MKCVVKDKECGTNSVAEFAWSGKLADADPTVLCRKVIEMLDLQMDLEQEEITEDTKHCEFRQITWCWKDQTPMPIKFLFTE